MNNQIVANLYQFWNHIGKLNNTLIETGHYSAVSMDGSDFPNRIFDLNNELETLEQIKNESNLPNRITIAKTDALASFLNSHSNVEYIFSQKNMAIDLNAFSLELIVNANIKRVKTEQDAIDFADTASQSFGYVVDPKVIVETVKKSQTIRLFTYEEDGECLGCGMVFFDTNNNAGLHMIGTIPQGRGKGIGKSMTEKLLLEAKENNANYCVLHASKMGEPIYTKLGFQPYGEIETYKIVR